MKNENGYLITIITVSLMDYEALVRTVDSVLPQMGEDIEYWIVDGGSGNPIRDYLMSLESKGVKTISEKDNGIYDAMNKGIKLAHGEWIVFINAGDYLLPNAIKKIKNHLDSEKDCIYCNTVIERDIEGQKYYRAYKAISDSSKISRGMICSHQSLLVKTEKLREIQGFDQRFKIAADWDSVIRLFKSATKIEYIDMEFCVCDMDGVSSHPHAFERHEVRKKNKVYKMVDWWMLMDFVHDFNSIITKSLFGNTLKKKISVKVKGFRKSHSENENNKSDSFGYN